MTESNLVLVDIADGVAVVTWHRPERRNAWSIELENAYFGILDDLDANDEVRAIVVTGSGTFFCPGMDLNLLKARANGDRSGYGTLPRRPLAYALTARKPLIAAINGGCSGIGLLQALVCDVRFVADEAKVAVASTTRGLPAEFSFSWLLERIIGHGSAVDLLLSGRALLGPEAANLGLASRSVPRDDLLDTAVAYARNLAENCSPAAMAVVKRQMLRDWGNDRETSEAEAIRLAELLQAGPDFGEGVISFIERRAPRFEPLARRVVDHITPSISLALEAHIPS